MYIIINVSQVVSVERVEPMRGHTDIENESAKFFKKASAYYAGITQARVVRSIIMIILNNIILYNTIVGLLRRHHAGVCNEQYHHTLVVLHNTTVGPLQPASPRRV